MERKIGEIFEYQGEWYQCVELPSDYIGCICNICSMNFDGKCPLPIRECQAENGRSDRKDVIFKKLEKVGEPCHFGKKLMQTYKLFTKPVTPLGLDCFTIREADNSSLKIEIKQNKEEMEENKLNLKPFDLEAAIQGKPVCTRDGRKARIVCFDAEGGKPLIVLSKIDGKEVILRYTEKGQSDYYHSPTPREDDLMMLIEKGSGYVNVLSDYENRFVDSTIYSTPEEARRNGEDKDYYIATVRIEWEE